MQSDQRVPEATAQFEKSGPERPRLKIRVGVTPAFVDSVAIRLPGQTKLSLPLAGERWVCRCTRCQLTLRLPAHSHATDETKLRTRGEGEGPSLAGSAIHQQTIWLGWALCGEHKEKAKVGVVIHHAAMMLARATQRRRNPLTMRSTCKVQA